MLLVYTSKVTNRLRYIFEHFFTEMLGMSYSITIDKDEFIAYQDEKLNYSSRKFGDELFFYATPLLFERGIKQQKIKVDDFENTKMFFICKNNSDLPFDPFAAAFYLISRYEEYLPVEKDRFGRFPAAVSLAAQQGFLQKPVIDIWINKLEVVLKRRFPTVVIHRKSYKYLPTYDIDIAYAYTQKGVLRTLGAYAMSVKRMNFEEIKQRTRAIVGLDKDPYDTYEWQLQLQRKYKLTPVYFFLVGEYGVYDKNISIDNFTYQELIQSIGDVCDVGIHPSFQSNSDIRILEKETQQLSAILKKVIIRSRQHYIKLDITETYQNLIELDISKDYSMGYPDNIGFRAGTCSSFLFYDLPLEIKTNLRVYPFMVMDVTLKDYLQLSPAEAFETVKKLIHEVKAVKGMFSTLWHNNTLCECEDWIGWRTMYEQMVKEASS